MHARPTKLPNLQTIKLSRHLGSLGLACHNGLARRSRSCRRACRLRCVGRSTPRYCTRPSQPASHEEVRRSTHRLCLLDRITVCAVGARFPRGSEGRARNRPESSDERTGRQSGMVRADPEMWLCDRSSGLKAGAARRRFRSGERHQSGPTPANAYLTE